MNRIRLIYTYIDGSRHRQLRNDRSAAYYILLAHDQDGKIDRNILESVYSESFDGEEILDDERLVGPFDDQDMINRFGFNLSQRQNSEGIELISVKDLNAALEKSYNARELKAELSANSDFIENIDHKKKGIFNRIFD